jgi:hypothetical protein
LLVTASVNFANRCSRLLWARVVFAGCLIARHTVYMTKNDLATDLGFTWDRSAVPRNVTGNDVRRAL